MLKMHTCMAEGRRGEEGRRRKRGGEEEADTVGGSQCSSSSVREETAGRQLLDIAGNMYKD